LIVRRKLSPGRSVKLAFGSEESLCRVVVTLGDFRPVDRCIVQRILELANFAKQLYDLV